MFDWKSVALGFVLCLISIAGLIALVYFIEWCQDLAFKREMKIEDKKRKKDKLNRAKEIIRELLGCLQQDTNDPETNYYVVKYIEKAERFLEEKR